MNHVQTAHPSSSDKNAILISPVLATGVFLSENSLLAQPAVPQYANSQRNDGGVVLPTSSSNRNPPIRRGATPPVNMHQMARGNGVGGSNQTIVEYTRPLINQLDAPISSNANELVDLTEEQNDLDLNLRL
ncbi:hypothetical protein HAX54_000045 [Datura stramonium]|uniref:Uncharacterized protein n=1 Tax=Datura stramonium TaxID=4076 RepID=A0ABS8RGF4_DATST|nr:hypothetical protein [Datura stramonium]